VKPQPLTATEEVRLRAAVAEGRLWDREIPAWAASDREQLVPQLKKLLKLWEALDPVARETVTDDLARRTGAGELEQADLGATIAERLALIRHRKSRAVPGLYEAVEVLLEVWTGRRHSADLANLRRDLDEGKAPSDLHVFIASHLISVFGAETFSRSKRPEQVLEAACIRVDTVLREARSRVAE